MIKTFMKKTNEVKPTIQCSKNESCMVVINGPATKCVLSRYMKYLEIREDSRARRKAHCLFSI